MFFTAWGLRERGKALEVKKLSRRPPNPGGHRSKDGHASNLTRPARIMKVRSGRKKKDGTAPVHVSTL